MPEGLLSTIPLMLMLSLISLQLLPETKSIMHKPSNYPHQCSIESTALYSYESPSLQGMDGTAGNANAGSYGEKDLSRTWKAPFARDCSCEFDWTDAFCIRVEAYKKLDPIDAPTICVCRRLGDEDSCKQFITRCFLNTAFLGPERRRPISPVEYNQDAFRNRGGCSCCFNQPDEYCSQLDCVNMRPDFGRDSRDSTSCVCHGQSNYPYQICGASTISSISKIKVSGRREGMGERWETSPQITPIDEMISLTLRPQPSNDTAASHPVVSSPALAGTSSATSKSSFWPLLLIAILLLTTFTGIGLILLLIRRRNGRRKENRLADPSVVAADEAMALRPLATPTYLREKVDSPDSLANTHGEGENTCLPQLATIDQPLFV